MTCEPCKDQGPCVQFPLIFYNFGLGKSYTNPLLGIEVICPNGETVISYVQPGTVNFQLPYPPGYTGDYPPLVLGCASGGQVVRNVPSGSTQEQIDAIVEDMILTCATAIAIANAPCRTIQFKSEVVYFSHPCTAPAVLIYNGTLPEWITLDSPGGRLVGKAGTFFGSTLAEANASAQANIDAFGNAAVTAGTLKCVSLDWCQLVWSTINAASTGGAAVFTHSESCGNFQNTTIQGPGGFQANTQVSGVMSYTGPAQNCNLRVTVSGVIGDPDNLARVSVRYGGVSTGPPPPGTSGLVANIPFANGTYNFPFVITASVAKEILVTSQHVTTFNAPGGGSSWTCLITTL